MIYSSWRGFRIILKKKCFSHAGQLCGKIYWNSIPVFNRKEKLKEFWSQAQIIFRFFPELPSPVIILRGFFFGGGGEVGCFSSLPSLEGVSVVEKEARKSGSRMNKVERLIGFISSLITSVVKKTRKNMSTEPVSITKEKQTCLGWCWRWYKRDKTVVLKG